MPWPNPQDYNEAIQIPAVSFTDPELRLGSAELTRLGLPRVVSGAFASVYRFHCPSRDVAVRCFLQRVPEIQNRYSEISKFIMADDLPYTVPFEYLQSGIKIGPAWYPILKMDWVEGLNLVDYIAQIVNCPQDLARLLTRFDQMIIDLRKAGVAHGDLQHGNIIVVDDQLRLVDYDGMFVPALKGKTSNELGHRNFQHPLRDSNHFDSQLDIFSSWIIHISIEILLIDPGLWSRFGGDECLLFKSIDFKHREQLSPVRTKLACHKSEQIRQWSEVVQSLCRIPFESLPRLDSHRSPAELAKELSGIEEHDSPRLNVSSSRVGSYLFPCADADDSAPPGESSTDVVYNELTRALACADAALMKQQQSVAAPHLQKARSLMLLHDSLSSPENLCRLGNLLLKSGALEQAKIECFQPALLFPQNTTNNGQSNFSAIARVGLAQISLLQNRKIDAMDYFQEAIKCGSNSIEARLSLAEFLLESSNASRAKEAINHLDKALRGTITDEDQYLRIGNAFSKFDKEKALEVYSQALIRFPVSAQLFFHRGLCRYQNSEYMRSLTDLSDCLKLDARHFGARFGQGVALRKLARDSEALKAFNEALKLRPDSVLALEQRAEILISWSKFKEALIDCDAVLKSEPKMLNVLTLRGYCYFALGNYACSLADLEHEINAGTNQEKLWSTYIKALSLSGDSNKVIIDSTKLMDGCPLPTFALLLRFERAKTHARLKHWGEALDDLLACEQLNDIAVLQERAEVYLALGKMDLAVCDFTKLALSNRADAQSAFKAASLYFKSVRNSRRPITSSKQTEQYLALFEQAFKEKPAFKKTAEAAIYWETKAELLYQKGDDRAFGYYNRALRLNPGSQLSLLRRAEISLQLADPQRAHDDYAQLLCLDSQMVEAQAGLGQSLLRLGKPFDSIRLLTKALDLVDRPMFHYWRARAYVATGDHKATNDAVMMLLSMKGADGEPSVSTAHELILEICERWKVEKELLAAMSLYKLAPDMLPLLLERALLKLKTGSFNESIRDFGYILKVTDKINFDLPPVLFMELRLRTLCGRAQAYAALRKKAPAKKDLLAAISTNARCTSAHFELAKIYFDESKYKESLHHLEEASQGDTQSISILETLASIQKKLGDDLGETRTRQSIEAWRANSS